MKLCFVIESKNTKYYRFNIVNENNLCNIRSFDNNVIIKKHGGWGGIRTHEGVAPLPVFKTGAFNHSTTHPLRYFVDNSAFKFIIRWHKLYIDNSNTVFKHIVDLNVVFCCRQ